MIKLFTRYLSKYKAKTILGMVTKGVEVVFELMVPLIIARMIDTGVAKRDINTILRLGFLLIIFTFVGYAFTLVCQYLASHVSQAVGTDLRNDAFKASLELGMADVDVFGSSSLLTRITNDINQIQLGIALFIRMFVRWPFLALGSAIAAISINTRLGLIFFVAVPAIVVLFFLVLKRSIVLYGKLQEGTDRISLRIRDALKGARIIRAFNQEKRDIQKIESLIDEQLETGTQIGKFSTLLNPVTMLIVNLAIVAILWQGSNFIATKSYGLTLGEIVAFVNYLTQMLLAISYLANLALVFTRAFASAKRVDELLGYTPCMSYPDVSLQLSSSNPALSFDHVSFSFGDEAQRVLDDISFSVEAGQSIGIIGGTGSGKSILASLMARLFDPKEGCVSLFGNDIRSYSAHELTQLIAYVPQNPSLISGTIRSNLCWRNKDASDEELKEALRRAQALDFVLEKSAGLDEFVEAGGSNFSGGQRQRLAIARALVGSPAILILDDSSSALDFMTDAHLRFELDILQGLTQIRISQRVAAVMGSHKICVLDHGHLLAFASHEELYDSCELYREICTSQHIDRNRSAYA